MDDKPVSGGGAYPINWDEIDQLENPFEPGISQASKSVPKSPTKLVPQTEAPIETNHLQEQTNNSNLASPQNASPSKTAKLKPKPPIRTTKLEGKPNSPGAISKTANDNTPVPATENQIQENTGPLDTQAAPHLQTLHSGPSPEELSEALMNAGLVQDVYPEADPNAQVNGKNTYESDSIETKENQPVESTDAVPVLNRIDSSTRPASPAQLKVAGHTPSVDPVHPALLSSKMNSLNSDQFESIQAELVALRKERDELKNTVEVMKHCINEYDRSFQHLIEEKKHNQSNVNVSVADLIAERDQAIEALTTIEKAFGDLHRRFEKSKQVIEGFKKNEETLKQNIDEYKTLLQRQEQKYLALKKHAEEQLLKVNQNTDSARQEFETTVTKLQASLRMTELQVERLQNQLEQKTRENVELTNICEELLGKYGASS